MMLLTKHTNIVAFRVCLERCY